PPARRPVLLVEREWWCGWVGGEGGAGPGRPDGLLDYSRRDGSGDPDVEVDSVVVGVVLERQVRLPEDQAFPARVREADEPSPPGGGGGRFDLRWHRDLDQPGAGLESAVAPVPQHPPRARPGSGSAKDAQRGDRPVMGGQVDQLVRSVAEVRQELVQIRAADGVLEVSRVGHRWSLSVSEVAVTACCSWPASSAG